MIFSIYTAFITAFIFVVFYLIRRRARAYFLLLTSLFFIACMDYRSCIWAIVVSAVVYFLGLFEGGLISKEQKTLAGLVTTLGVVFCAGALVVLKLVSKWSFGDGIFQKFIMPLGFSYYIFQAISYLVDIYKGKIKPERNILFFSLYMCYFPKFLSGPIERPGHFLEEIKKVYSVNLFERNRLSISFPTILYGVFLKMVVADRIAPLTATLFKDHASFSSIWLLVGMFLYAVQIYCDFAGYSAIAVGVSNLFGIKITDNFFVPYFSENISVFWRRWHISLSEWLKDYVYIPLGGNRKGQFRKILNVVVVFTICGLWHGVDASFFVWGMLHVLYTILYDAIAGKKESLRISGTVGRILTFISVSFAWIFFGMDTLENALGYVGNMLSFRGGEGSLIAQMQGIGFLKVDILIPFYVAIMILIGNLMQKKQLPVGKALYSLSPVVRYTIEYVLIMLILLMGVYGPGYDAGSFIYMSF